MALPSLLPDDGHDVTGQPAPTKRDDEIRQRDTRLVAHHRPNAFGNRRFDLGILVKRLRGATLESGQLWLLEPILC